MSSVLLLNFEEFSPVYGPINFPINSLIYRGYDTKYPILSDRPAYFTSNLEVARAYGSVSPFRTTKLLKLYDLRYIKHVLLELFQQLESNDQDVLKFCKILTISYGLTTCFKQLELLKDTFGPSLGDDHYQAIRKYLLDSKMIHKKEEIVYSLHPFETQGIRIGETETDAISVSFLKDLFRGQIDGYIAPKIKSAFHFRQGGLNPAELVIFNPLGRGVKVLEQPNSYYINKMEFEYYLQHQINNVFLMRPNILDSLSVDKNKVNKGMTKTSLIMIGGYNITPYCTYNKILDEGGDNYKKIQEFVKRTMSKLFGDDYYTKTEIVAEADEIVTSENNNTNTNDTDTNTSKGGGYMTGIRVKVKEGVNVFELWKNHQPKKSLRKTGNHPELS